MNKLWNHLLPALGGAYLQLIVRILALTPAYLAVMGLTPLSPYLLYACTVVMTVFLVMPFRSYGWARLREVMGGSGGKRPPQCHWRRGLGRALRGTAWGIPFWAMAIWLVWGYFNENIGVYTGAFRSLGALVAKEGSSTLDKGVIVYMGLLLLSALIYAYGWWRDTAADYLDAGTQHLFRAARGLQRKNLASFCKKALIQACLLLPSVVLMALVIARFYRGEISLDDDAFSKLRSVLMALSQPLPGSVIMYLTCILLVVHVPLCLVRKASMAKMVLDLEKKA